MILKDKDIRAIYNGYGHTLLLMKNGDLKGFGESSFGLFALFSEIHFLTRKRKKKGQLATKSKGVFVDIHLGERVSRLMGEHEVPLEWSFDNHDEFPEEMRESITSFLLCMRSKLERRLWLPRPIFSIVINFSLTLEDSQTSQNCSIF